MAVSEGTPMKLSAVELHGGRTCKETSDRLQRIEKEHEEFRRALSFIAYDQGNQLLARFVAQRVLVKVSK